ncbi:MAG: HEAT repeat domain-containing protein [Acidobacteria bacterium]|nr:HEAT repeat domain-containing protein [Acidobacteriota bacterium]
MRNLRAYLFYSPRWPWIPRVAALLLLAGFLGLSMLTARYLIPIGNVFIRYAVAFIVVQVAVLMTLTLFLLVGKVVAIRRESLRSSRVRQLEGMLADYILNRFDREVLASFARQNPDEATTVFTGAFRVLRGSSRLMVEEIFVSCGLYERLVDEAGSADPSRALLALTAVREVDHPRGRQVLEKCLQHPVHMVQMAARVAALRNSDEELRWRVMYSIGKLPFWQRVVLFHQMPNDPDLLARFVAESLESQHDETVLTALELVMTRQRLIPARIPERILHSKNLELRVKLFKALPFLAGEGSTASLLRWGLADADWRVRSMAARACGSLRYPELAPVLERMAAESESQVEVGHAARALMAMGSGGQAHVQGLLEGADPVRRRILEETLGAAALTGVRG